VLARCALGSWGEHAYLVELGVIPSKTTRNQVPTEERIAFLEEMMRVFRRAGTRNVIFHSREKAHAAAQGRLAAVFLDIEPTELASIRMGADYAGPMEIWDSAGRRAIRCRHLSNLFGDEAIVQAVSDRLL
jgi:hypothetical protein